MEDVKPTQITLAQDGDAGALEGLVRSIQDRVYRLALRMLADPIAAQDATQEILIRIVTKLSTFRGESKFGTWVYQVAINYLLTARKVIATDPSLSFEMFSEDLLNGLADEQHMAPEDHILINELRLKCTLAMLLCLDRDHRAAYVLGEILEFDHGEAAEVLGIKSANFRKRLSRARSCVQDFTAKSCGLAGKAAACSCQKRLPAAISSGRIGPSVTEAFDDAPTMTDVEIMVASTQANLITAKLQRATGSLTSKIDFAREVLKVVDPPI
ncbi:MAG: RNA polymerase sigma factor [Pseudomonadota bacterium]